jgi:hypothetical protein
MILINDLWNNGNETEWHSALQNYWRLVKFNHIVIEKELDSLDSNVIKKMNSGEWYEFLLNKYFFWKYTAPNRYATTTAQLKKYTTTQDGLEELMVIKNRIFNCDLDDVVSGLKIACSIKGLGTAGASGLLAVLFPEYFATVDQFVVKSLLNVDHLPERELILTMWPDELKIKDASILIYVMKLKARELNNKFGISYWTPRKIDMILWSVNR